MARIADLTPENLTPEQSEVWDEIAGSRGGAARGPFSAWLRTPTVAVAASRFGGALRLEGGLDKRLFELATLVGAAYWKAAYPWAVHAPMAIDQGVDPAAVEAIRTGTEPEFAREDERLVYDVGVELLATGTLGDATYERALEALGTELLVELVTTVMFYSVAAVVANVFEVDVPRGEQPFGRTVPAADAGSPP